MPDEVVTIKEIAALLNLAEKIHAGESRAFKVRRQWRIKRRKLDQWVDAQTRGGEVG